MTGPRTSTPLCKECRQPLQVRRSPRAPGEPDDMLMRCVNDECEMERLEWRDPEIIRLAE
ncbi:hypothetical protein NJB1507_44800 [Mycobacterium marinum]|nr:hypothetical protein NJB1507_44800 [Mycobacterium marinum]GJO54525.1 hypothetical protein NJB1604_45350 [Mycobacterium marinum]